MGGGMFNCKREISKPLTYYNCEVQESSTKFVFLDKQILTPVLGLELVRSWFRHLIVRVKKQEG